MPELPEVETLRRELARAVKGKIFKSVSIDWPKMVKPLSVLSFQKQIKNKKILAVNRRAKVLILKLSNNKYLLIHLKLTGQLIYKIKSEILDLKSEIKYTHIIFEFTDGSELFFNDMRKFGWARLEDRVVRDKIVGNFGVEPLSKKFTLKKFKEIVSQYPKRKIKQVLLDQKLISGVGNIYTDESCFRAGILPSRLAGEIKDDEMRKLRQYLIKILKLSISVKGTSSATYVNLNGSQGGFVPYLKVYGRKGERCRRRGCMGIIERIKINGRGTYFCPKCQK